MGYEQKMYLGEVHTWNSNPYFMVVAEVDLCKTGEDWNYHFNNGIEVYFYGTNGNTEIKKDSYGDKLKAIPAKNFLPILKEAWKKSKKDFTGWSYGYRRFYIALKTLEAFCRTFKKDGYIFLYGH